MPAPPVRFQAHTGAASLARPAAEAVDRLTVRRAALWALLAAKLVASWGVRWDIEWHLRIGRDSFWIAPHVMTYAGVIGIVLLSFGGLLWERARGTLSSPGFRAAAGGIAITVAAAPIDDAWHRLFGLDVTLWSPPHLLGIQGSVGVTRRLRPSVRCVGEHSERRLRRRNPSWGRSRRGPSRPPPTS